MTKYTYKTKIIKNHFTISNINNMKDHMTNNNKMNGKTNKLIKMIKLYLNKLIIPLIKSTVKTIQISQIINIKKPINNSK